MLTIEELIAYETAKAKECKAQADFGLDYFTHKKLSYLERGRNAFCAKRHNQIAELLRELVKRRKAQEIIYCKDCNWNDETGYCCYCNFHYRNVRPDNYCSWAERKADGERTGD